MKRSFTLALALLLAACTAPPVKNGRPGGIPPLPVEGPSALAKPSCPLAAPPEWTSADGKVVLYETGFKCELVGTVDATAGTPPDSPYLFTSIYALQVNLSAGDFVRLDAQAELSNPTVTSDNPAGYPLEADEHIAIVQAPLTASRHEGMPLSLPAGDNITQVGHHKTIHRYAYYVAKAAGPVTFSLVVTFATEPGELPAQGIVEKGYGQLSARVEKAQ